MPSSRQTQRLWTDQTIVSHIKPTRESHYNYFAYPMLHQREAKTWWHIHFCKYTWFTWYSQYIHHHLFSPTLLCSFTSLVTGNNRRTISEMCFCTKDIRLSAEVKNYIKDIAPFLQPSDKFYVTAINATFMKEGRVYLVKEFSKKYIAPLARWKDSTNQGTNSWTPLIHHGSPQMLQLEIGMNPFCDNQQLPDWNNLHIPLLQDRSPGSNGRCLVKAICIGYNLSSSCYRQVTLPGLSKYLQPVSMFIISALYSLSIDI